MHTNAIRACFALRIRGAMALRTFVGQRILNVAEQNKEAVPQAVGTGVSLYTYFYRLDMYLTWLRRCPKS